jgi:HEAT repeat protein
VDQAEFHSAAISKDPKDRIIAFHELKNFLKDFPDKDQAERDLLQLAKDEDAEVRSWAAESISTVFGDLPNKSQVWNYILLLASDKDAKVRISASSAIVDLFSDLPDKSKAEYDILRSLKDQSAETRTEVAWIIGKTLGSLPDKSQAWKELLELAKDESPDVRDEAVRSIGAAFDKLPNKVQAENELLQLAKNEDSEVRKGAAWAISKVFGDLPNKSQAEFDLLKLAKDENPEVRSLAAEAIGDIFSDLPDKSLAEDDLLLLAKDESAEVRNSAAWAIGVAFRDLPNKDEAENEILQLAKDEDAEARSGAARAMGGSFSNLRDKSLAEDDLLQLAKDESAEVRNSAAWAIGVAFSDLPDKARAKSDLLRLAEDEDEEVRTEATRAIGIVQASNDLHQFNENGKAKIAAESVITSSSSGLSPDQLDNALSSDVPVQKEQLQDSEKSIPKLAGKIPPLDIPSYAIPDSTEGEDLLGSTVYAQALADFIRNEKTEKPITIGIDAAWGMGKTFLMEMICKELVGEERCRRSRGLIGVRAYAQGHKSEAKENQLSTVNEDDQQKRLMAIWFNAWKYDKEGSLWAALTLEILRQLRQQSGFRDWAELIIKVNLARFEWESLFEKIVRITILAIPVLLLSIVVCLFNFFVTKYDIVWLLTQSFQDYGLAWLLALIGAMVVTFKYLYKSLIGPFDLKISQYLREPNYGERIGFLAQFEEDFSRMINIITKGGQKTLVIFIDDLDRCSPPKPVEIIEAINTLIDAKDCVFVIGMDGRAVASSIEAKYKDLRDYLDKTGDSAGASLGQRFLDKIIQINFRIPTAERNSISNLIKHMMPVIDRSDENLIHAKALDRSERDETKINVSDKHFQERRDVLGTSEKENEDAKVAFKKEKSSEYRGEIDLPESDQDKKKEEQKILEFAQKFDDFDEVLDAIKRAQPFLRANPRRIKKFLNYFRLLALIANRKRLLESKIISLDMLAKWTVIQIRWPDIIDTLETDKSFVERLNKAQKLQNRIQKSSDRLEILVQGLTNPDFNRLEYDIITDTIASDRRDIDQLLADPKISQMVEEHEFITLVGEFKGTLYNYVHLAQVV